MKVLPPQPGVMPIIAMYDASLIKFSMPWKTPRPVADVRPWMPPWLIGFPVTQACALMSLWPEGTVICCKLKVTYDYCISL